MGLLIGPGIAGGVTAVLDVVFAFGGNLGGAKLILVAKVTGGLVVEDVLDTSPLVNLLVPFEVTLLTLLKGFFNGAETGRLEGLGEPLVRGCLLTKVEVRGVEFVFGVVADFEAIEGFGVVGVLGDEIGVVLVTVVVFGAVGVVLAEVGRDAVNEVLGVDFGAFETVVVVAFNVLVFETVLGRTLVGVLEVDGAVLGLDSGFDVVVDVTVFLRTGANGFEANGFVEVVFVVVVLVLDTDVSTFLGEDFFEAKLTPVTAATAAVPTAAATAISEICN